MKVKKFKIVLLLLQKKKISNKRKNQYISLDFFLEFKVTGKIDERF